MKQDKAEVTIIETEKMVIELRKCLAKMEEIAQEVVIEETEAMGEVIHNKEIEVDSHKAERSSKITRKRSLSMKFTTLKPRSI